MLCRWQRRRRFISSTCKTWNTFYAKSDLSGWEVEPDKDSGTREKVSGDLSCLIMSHVFGQTKREETRGGRDTHSSWLLQICPLSVCRFSVVATLRRWREPLVFNHIPHVTLKRILAHTWFHVTVTKKQQQNGCETSLCPKPDAFPSASRAFSVSRKSHFALAYFIHPNLGNVLNFHLWPSPWQSGGIMGIVSDLGVELVVLLRWRKSTDRRRTTTLRK